LTFSKIIKKQKTNFELVWVGRERNAGVRLVEPPPVVGAGMVGGGFAAGGLVWVGSERGVWREGGRPRR
jgi:hypothetical protein